MKLNNIIKTTFLPPVSRHFQNIDLTRSYTIIKEGNQFCPLVETPRGKFWIYSETGANLFSGYKNPCSSIGKAIEMCWDYYNNYFLKKDYVPKGEWKE